MAIKTTKSYYAKHLLSAPCKLHAIDKPCKFSAIDAKCPPCANKHETEHYSNFRFLTMTIDKLIFDKVVFDKLIYDKVFFDKLHQH